jgi:hypothetical protein
MDAPLCDYSGFGAGYFGQYPAQCAPPQPVLAPCQYGGFGTLFFGEYPVCFKFVPPIPPIPPKPAQDLADFADDQFDGKREQFGNDAEELEIIGVLTVWLGRN